MATPTIDDAYVTSCAFYYDGIIGVQENAYRTHLTSWISTSRMVSSARRSLKILAVAGIALTTMAPGCPVVTKDPSHQAKEGIDPSEILRAALNPAMRSTPYVGHDAVEIFLELYETNPEGDWDQIVLYLSSDAPQYLVALLGDLGAAVGTSNPWRSRWRPSPRSNSVKGSADQARTLEVVRKVDDRGFFNPLWTVEICQRHVVTILKPGHTYIAKVANASGGCDLTVTMRRK